MGDLHWYAAMAGMATTLATVFTGVDLWILGRVSRGRAMALASRWGFFSAIVSYAWGIDSGRVPYSDTGIEALLLVGVLLTALLWWAGHRHNKRG